MADQLLNSVPDGITSGDWQRINQAVQSLAVGYFSGVRPLGAVDVPAVQRGRTAYRVELTALEWFDDRSIPSVEHVPESRQLLRLVASILQRPSEEVAAA